MLYYCLLCIPVDPQILQSDLDHWIAAALARRGYRVELYCLEEQDDRTGFVAGGKSGWTPIRPACTWLTF